MSCLNHLESTFLISYLEKKKKQEKKGRKYIEKVGNEKNLMWEDSANQAKTYVLFYLKQITNRIRMRGTQIITIKCKIENKQAMKRFIFQAS